MQCIWHELQTLAEVLALFSKLSFLEKAVVHIIKMFLKKKDFSIQIVFNTDIRTPWMGLKFWIHLFKDLCNYSLKQSYYICLPFHETNLHKLCTGSFHLESKGRVILQNILLFQPFRKRSLKLQRTCNVSLAWAGILIYN